MRKKTNSGFEFEIQQSALEDWELMELIDELESGNYIVTVRIAKKLLGDEQYKALKKHCTVEGKVSSPLMVTEIGEIMNSNQDLKN